MLCALLVLVRAASEEHKYQFGDPTKILPAGKYENKHVIVNVVRDCFGPKIDGSQGFTIKDQVLTFREDHPLIKPLDVFVEPGTQEMYEVEKKIDAKTFTVRRVNPLMVFTQIQMKTNMLIQPRQFEGLVSVDVEALGLSRLEYDVTPSEEIQFLYVSNQSTPNTSNHYDIFALSVDVLGFHLGLGIHYNTTVSVIPVFSGLVTHIEYEREFHHETRISGVVDKVNLQADATVLPRSYLKRSYITHAKCYRLAGTFEELNFSTRSDIVFAVRIGGKETSVTTTNEYQIHNYFTPGDHQNNTVSYNVSMTTQRRCDSFFVGNWEIWSEWPGRVSSVVVPQPQRRVDIVRNESLVQLATNDIPKTGDTFVLHPATVSCNGNRKIILRFDICLANRVIDSLLLEPMTFDGTTDKLRQERMKPIERNNKATIRVIVRDLHDGTSKYMDKNLPTGEGTYTVCGDGICVEVVIGKAYQIEPDTMYAVNNSVKYAYFAPSEVGLMGYSVIRDEEGAYYTNSLHDIFHTPSLLSDSEQSVFWNWLTFDISFRDITFPEAVKSVEMSINVNRGSGKMQNVYQMIFNRDRILDDHVLFQMQDTWSLQIYVTVTENQDTQSTLLFKFSYKQILDMKGNDAVFRAHDCNVTLHISTQDVCPILALENVSAFAVAMIWDVATKSYGHTSRFTVARIVKDDVDSTRPWPNLKATFKTDTIVLAKLWTVEGFSIVDLEPGVNVRYIQESLVISLPMLTSKKEVDGFDDVFIFASSEDCYCDRYDNIKNHGFDIGCLEYNEHNGIQVWDPPEASYTSDYRNLGTAFTLSMARVITPVSSVKCALRNVRSFPAVATVIEMDWDRRFDKLTIQCDRCSGLEIGNNSYPPDLVEHTFSVPSFLPGTPIRALCPGTSGAYCIKTAAFKEASLVRFPSSEGIESYTMGFDTVFGISQQVVEQKTINYSQKTSGFISSSKISHFNTLVLEIEIAVVVSITGYVNTTAIPFSAIQLLADPQLFFAEFGITKGSFLEDGRVSCQVEDFVQPVLGEYNVSTYTLINLTRIFGFNHSNITTFIVRCSKKSQVSEDGKCLPVVPFTSESFTASWFTPNDPDRQDYGVIIVGCVIAGVFLIGVLAGVLLFLRKKRQTEMSASAIIEKHLLEDCSFAI